LKEIRKKKVYRDCNLITVSEADITTIGWYVEASTIFSSASARSQHLPVRERERECVCVCVCAWDEHAYDRYRIDTEAERNTKKKRLCEALKESDIRRSNPLYPFSAVSHIPHCIQLLIRPVSHFKCSFYPSPSHTYSHPPHYSLIHSPLHNVYLGPQS